eukprot:scaffold27541_cov131-Skeletonema_marinoi.AAC.7
MMKKTSKKDEDESIPSYRVVSVSLPKPDRRTEDLTALSTPKMQSQGIISATLDQNHHRLLSFPQGKQDASNARLLEFSASFFSENSRMRTKCCSSRPICWQKS